MFQIFYTDPQTKFLKSIDPETIDETFDAKGKWIHMTNPTDKEIEFVCEKIGTPEEMIKAALDDEEMARIDRDEDWLLTLFDIPTIEEEENYYSYISIPLGVMYNASTIVTVCLKRTVLLNDFATGRVKGFDTNFKTRFLLQLLYGASTKFLQYLRQIDKASQRIQSDLYETMNNDSLVQLLDLENSLVYFSTSLRSNNAVIEKLARVEAKNFYEDDLDLWEDVGIENRQAMEMCRIYSDILKSTTDAFANIINNNLNNVMKKLTIYTVILAIPTLIYSMWGMNTPVPWQDNPAGFWILTAISVVITVVAGILLFKKKKFKKK